MKKLILSLPLLLALLMPGRAFAEENDKEREFDEEEFETIEEDVLKYIKSVEPRAVKLMEAWAEDEEDDSYLDTLIEIHESLEEIAELNEEAPEFGELYNRILAAEIKLEYLGHAIQESESDSERAKLAAELKEFLPIAFEDRMKEAEMEIAMLREEIAEVEADWKKRKANKEKIIEKRFNELTGKDDGLDW